MTKRTKFYTEANDEALKALREIDQTLTMINLQLERYRNLDDYDYAHVGDLKEIDRQLRQVWEFFAETD